MSGTRTVHHASDRLLRHERNGKAPVLAVAYASALIAAIALSSTVASAGEEGPTCHGHPATFVGTPGKDRFRTDEFEFPHEPGKPAVVVLRGGRDRLEEFEQRDLIVCGGQGRDNLDMATNRKRVLLDGGPGRDDLGMLTDPEFSHNARMSLFGGDGDDFLKGGNSPDHLHGGGGSDLLDGLHSDDVLDGNGGGDKLYGSGGSDRMHGGEGNDYLKGDRPFPDIYTPGRDVADGGSGTDECEAEVKRDCER